MSTAYGVDASGQVVGEATYLGDGGTLDDAGLWTVGSGGAVTLTNLGTLGGTYNCAFGINASGLIAGYWRIRPVRTTPFSGIPAAVPVAIADIGTFGGATSEANAFNDSGQVAGFADTSDGVSHAFVWTSSAGMRDLDAGSSLGRTAQRGQCRQFCRQRGRLPDRFIRRRSRLPLQRRDDDRPELAGR